MRWQVRHSKVRSSKPRLPGEIRANPILCLQTGHIGRSTKEEALRITPTENDRRFRRFWSVRQPTLGKIWRGFPGGWNRSEKFELVFQVTMERDRHGPWP